MKLIIISLLAALISGTVWAQKKNVRYEYKKYEKFDLAEIGVEGESGSPGEISVSPRLRNQFRNKLPERTNFNKEMKNAVQGIR